MNVMKFCGVCRTGNAIKKVDFSCNEEGSDIYDAVVSYKKKGKIYGVINVCKECLDFFTKHS